MLERDRLVSIGLLLDIARDLKSEHGENPEYDRALCELISAAAGFAQDGRAVVAANIGVHALVNA